MNHKTLAAITALALIPASTGWAQSRPEAPQAAGARCISSPVKLIAGSVEWHQTGIRLDTGTYDLVGTSTDAYPERVGITQLHEQWYVNVGAPIVFGPTPDLPDRVAEASIDVAGTFSTEGGEVVIRHRATVDAEGHSSYNSVTVARLCFTQRPTPTTTQVPVTTVVAVSTTVPATVPTMPTVVTNPTTPPLVTNPYTEPTTTTVASTLPVATVVSTSSVVMERAVPLASAALPEVAALPATPIEATPTFTG